MREEQGRLPEPVAFLERDVDHGDQDHNHAAGDEEGPVDIAEPQVLEMCIRDRCERRRPNRPAEEHRSGYAEG